MSAISALFTKTLPSKENILFHRSFSQWLLKSFFLYLKLQWNNVKYLKTSSLNI